MRRQEKFHRQKRRKMYDTTFMTKGSIETGNEEYAEMQKMLAEQAFWKRLPPKKKVKRRVLSMQRAWSRRSREEKKPANTMRKGISRCPKQAKTGTHRPQIARRQQMSGTHTMSEADWGIAKIQQGRSMEPVVDGI